MEIQIGKYFCVLISITYLGLVSSSTESDGCVCGRNVEYPWPCGEKADGTRDYYPNSCRMLCDGADYCKYTEEEKAELIKHYPFIEKTLERQEQLRKEREESKKQKKEEDSC